MTREELIQELIVQLIQIEGRPGDMNYIRGVADFILSREKQLLEKIVPLKKAVNMLRFYEFTIKRNCVDGKHQIDAVLSNAENALAIIEKESV